MKAIHYFFSWTLTLFVGLIVALGISGSPELAIVFTIAAAVCSMPFILVFCIVMFAILRKNPEKSKVHMTTFTLHLFGSLLTAAVLFGIESQFPGEFLLVIFGYFLVDSVFFHVGIERFHDVQQARPEGEDILDDFDVSEK